MLRRLLCCLFGALLTSGALAASSLENARRAAALLGPETWTRVIRIENVAARSVYPATFHALVFEFGGLLWFYTDVNGTQSFSLHTNNLAAEKAGFGRLLRAIEPGLATFAVVATAPAGAEGRFRGTLPNGCFIESAAALRRRVERGEWLGKARLLSFRGEAPAGPLAHTVLAYETPAGAFVLDPQRGDAPQRIGRRLPDDARSVAAAARPEVALTAARWVPTPPPRTVLVAAATPAGGRPPAETAGGARLQ